MIVQTIGPPKMGNHMLVKAVQLLGVNCSVDHTVYAEKTPCEKRVFIKRDPRNELISWLRFQRKPVTQGMVIAGMSDFNGRLLIDELAVYEGWLTDADTLVVRFEDLCRDDSCMGVIADYLGVPLLSDAFENLPGGTMTWTGKHSDYRVIWSPEVEAAWVECGGPALLSRWGY